MPRTGRPKNPESPYLMKEHTVGKYTYACTQRLKTIDGVEKFRRIHWGTLDSLKYFHPNHDFLYQPIEEQDRFIFPSEWNISEIQRYREPAPVPVNTMRISVEATQRILQNTKQYGDVWLLERISDRLGVRNDLMVTFEHNQTIVDDIMTVAMFMFISNKNLDRLEDHQDLEQYPAQHTLSPDVITRLEQSITEQHRLEFCSQRATRVTDGSVLAVDSTTKSAYGIKLTDIAWGKNKEGLKLPVTLELVVYSLSDHIPVYYNTFPGNTYDGRTMDIIIADLKEAGFNDYILVMDRAFPSKKNMEKFILNSHKVIACVKAGKGNALKKIKELKRFDFIPQGFERSEESAGLYVRQYDIPYEIELDSGEKKQADRYKLNLYFDPVYRSRILVGLDEKMAEISKELDELIKKKTIHIQEEVDILEQQYHLFDLHWEEKKELIEVYPELLEREKKFTEEEKPSKEQSSRRGRKRRFINTFTLQSYDRDQKAMLEEKLSAGFRAIETLGVDYSADEALYHYSLRPEQEMDNEQWKTLLPCDRERNWSDDGKRGGSFIQFVARIMACYLRFIWRSEPDLRKLFRSTLAIMDEMRKIRCVSYSNQSEMILSPFQGRQLDVCRIMKFSVPKGCAPRD